MNLYRIFLRGYIDYDQFDSAVVAAESPEDAKTIHPNTTDDPVPYHEPDYSWTNDLSKIEVILIGKAIDGTKRGVILASFNAG